MGVPTVNSLGQFIHYVGWRGLIGIAHPEIDNVAAGRAGLLLEFTDDIENVRREALNALKLFLHGSTTWLATVIRPRKKGLKP